MATPRAYDHFGELIPPVESRQRRWRRNWGVRLLLLVLGCGVLAACHYTIRHYRASNALEVAVAELDRTDPGWRLEDIEAARAVVPDDENSALAVKEASRLLPRDWPGADDLGRFIRMTQKPPRLQLSDEDAAWLRAAMQRSRPALREARKVADLPKGRYPITYKRGFVSTLLPDLQNGRQVVFLLQLDLLLQAQDGDIKGAVRTCLAQLNCARSVGDEPLFVSQLVRMAGVDTACRCAERVLAQGAPDPDDLLELQKLLQEEERFPRLLVAMRGERGGSHELLDALECGDVRLNSITDTAPSWSESLTGYAARDSVRTEHPRFLELETQMVRVAALPPHERIGPMAALEENARGRPPGVIRLLIPSVVKMDEAVRRTDGNLRCLIAALAAERYRSANGRFPDTLEQLAPDFLPAVPLDPQDGQPLRYQRLPDRVVVYSLAKGVGQANHQNTFDPSVPSPQGVGVAAHLFDVRHRRQPALEIVPPPTVDNDDPQ
jgi:hypothetical protein